eukprot:TRINITY_DN6641_c0_g1_i4.p1 TRINITY_DN6641_c0_g1~~TRINITY_DN6641_c0_g1_i4.p1  ORF type:complete len:453 (-),score=51.33 TRINITY_DN6641_c0_g1_i4:380-1738(-)
MTQQINEQDNQTIELSTSQSRSDNLSDEEDALLLPHSQNEHLQIEVPPQNEKNPQNQDQKLNNSCGNFFTKIIESLWSSGPLCIICASFSYSIGLLSVKLISERIQIFEILVTRSLFSMIVCLSIQWKTESRPVYGQFKHIHLLTARSFAGALAFFAYYFSAYLLPIGETIAIFFLNAATTAILGWLILGQKINIWGAIGILSSIVGVVFVSHPPFLFGGHEEWGSERTLGVACCLFASFMAGVAFVMIRLIGKRESPVTVSLWFHSVSLIGVVFVIVGYPFKASIPSVVDALMLGVISFTSFFGQLLLSRAFQIDKPSKIAAINYMQVVFSYGWGLIFLGDSVTVLGLIGVVFVAIGVVLVNKKEERDKNSKLESQNEINEDDEMVELTALVKVDLDNDMDNDNDDEMFNSLGVNYNEKVDVAIEDIKMPHKERIDEFRNQDEENIDKISR